MFKIIKRTTTKESNNKNNDCELKSPWEKPENKMPDEGSLVLAWAEVSMNGISISALTLGALRNGRWILESFIGQDVTVSYWMPIPELPEEVEE